MATVFRVQYRNARQLHRRGGATDGQGGLQPAYALGERLCSDVTGSPPSPDGSDPSGGAIPICWLPVDGRWNVPITAHGPDFLGSDGNLVHVPAPLHCGAVPSPAVLCGDGADVGRESLPTVHVARGGTAVGNLFHGQVSAADTVLVDDALGGVLHVTARAHLSELAANLEQDHAWRGARSGLAESSAGGSGSGTSMTGYDWRMERRHAGHLLAGNGLQLPRSSF